MPQTALNVYFNVHSFGLHPLFNANFKVTNNCIFDRKKLNAWKQDNFAFLLELEDDLKLF